MAEQPNGNLDMSWSEERKYLLPLKLSLLERLVCCERSAMKIVRNR